ncbi:MAG: shikimate kinase [Chlorobi bacterium]|nr:shikimate kinase [Chlorobiota bacterium]
MIVFLIGFMGCGKTTLGKRIANKLNWQFIDLDTYIEKMQNATVSEIFQNEGEHKFRIYEQTALNEIIKTENKTIVSTGGGTPCIIENIELMNKNGTTIYLKASYSLLVNRLKNSKKTRPLIKSMNQVELPIFVLKKLAEREPFYKKAQYIVDTKSIELGAIVKLINEL